MLTELQFKGTLPFSSEILPRRMITDKFALNSADRHHSTTLICNCRLFYGLRHGQLQFACSPATIFPDKDKALLVGFSECLHLLLTVATPVVHFEQYVDDVCATDIAQRLIDVRVGWSGLLAIHQTHGDCLVGLLGCCVVYRVSKLCIVARLPRNVAALPMDYAFTDGLACGDPNNSASNHVGLGRLLVPAEEVREFGPLFPLEQPGEVHSRPSVNNIYWRSSVGFPAQFVPLSQKQVSSGGVSHITQ